MADIDIGKIPRFKTDIEDTDIVHGQDSSGDFKSTWARVLAWFKGKITQTTAVTSGIALLDADDNFQKISKADLQKEILQGQLNSLIPLDFTALEAEGYTRLQIYLWDLRRKNPYKCYGDTVNLRWSDAEITQCLASQPAKDYLLASGYWFEDGTNGTVDKGGLFPRNLDTKNVRDKGRKINTVQTHAMQEFTYNGTQSLNATQNIDMSFETLAWEGSSTNTTGGARSENKGRQSGGDLGAAAVKFFKQLISLPIRIAIPLSVSIPITNKGKGANTAGETRPDSISVLSVQKIRDVDWRSIPAKPTKF